MVNVFICKTCSNVYGCGQSNELDQQCNDCAYECSCTLNGSNGRYVADYLIRIEKDECVQCMFNKHDIQIEKAQ